jgi:glucan phosphoethanolaminetransferase (alkaline phosphatase superfamily)
VKLSNSNNLFPGKRKIIHYIHPHYPYITRDDWTTKYSKSNASFWKQCRSGNITKKEAIEAYYMNLDYALKNVMELLPHLSGKTVISADHGEAFGEPYQGKPFYGHRIGVCIPALLEVPLFEVEQDGV